ncbi:hypothetical protein HA402_012628 [Bradysia odoriphaga]|nr:hypothetical protein HA402_012628 [Bradysia odoriphaga]
MLNSGDFQVIHAKFPTCHRAANGSFIDHFVVSSDIAEVVSSCAENIVKLSDHTGIAIQTSITFDDNRTPTNLSRKLYDFADFDAMNDEM